MNDIPLIDLAPLAGAHDPAARARVAHEIGEACEDTGFFAVTGHGVPAETVAALHSAAYAFFDLPLEQKLHAPTSSRHHAR